MGPLERATCSHWTETNPVPRMLRCLLCRMLDIGQSPENK